MRPKSFLTLLAQVRQNMSKGVKIDARNKRIVGVFFHSKGHFLLFFVSPFFMNILLFLLSKHSDATQFV